MCFELMFCGFLFVQTVQYVKHSTATLLPLEMLCSRTVWLYMYSFRLSTMVLEVVGNGLLTKHETKESFTTKYSNNISPLLKGLRDIKAPNVFQSKLKLIRFQLNMIHVRNPLIYYDKKCSWGCICKTLEPNSCA